MEQKTYQAEFEGFVKTEAQIELALTFDDAVNHIQSSFFGSAFDA